MSSIDDDNQTKELVNPLVPSQDTRAKKSSIDQLFHHALKYRGSEQYKRFFSFIAKFDHYSRYNSMLVYLQKPDVTFFGTSWYWKTKFKRKIKADAKPLLILAPNGPIILAYDIFETAGDKTQEEFLKEGLAQNLFEVKGDFRNEYLDDLKSFCSEYGIKVEVKPLNYFNAGAVTTYITGKLEIYLKEGHTKAQHFGTLCHELAHILLGHTGHINLKSVKGKKGIKLIKRPLTGQQCELEAETVSFLVCKQLGLETQTLEYLAGYITDEKDWSSFSYDTVIKVSDKLSGLIKSFGRHVA